MSRSRPGSRWLSRYETTIRTSRSSPAPTVSTRSARSRSGLSTCSAGVAWSGSSTPTSKGSRRRRCSRPRAAGTRFATTATLPTDRGSSLPDGQSAGPDPRSDRMGAVSQSGQAQVYDATSDEQRGVAVDAAALAIQRGRLVVLPTDTVYGVAADAFDPDAVARLLEAKGRGREMPPPVLVSTATTLDALATKVPDYARELTAAFWPGPLTLVCHDQPSLRWDLGETHGTVAVRMPDHDLAREILDRTGPLAVSSANLTGSPAATDADAAVEMLGDRVAVVVDGGATAGAIPST